VALSLCLSREPNPHPFSPATGRRWISEIGGGSGEVPIDEGTAGTSEGLSGQMPRCVAARWARLGDFFSAAAVGSFEGTRRPPPRRQWRGKLSLAGSIPRSRRPPVSAHGLAWVNGHRRRSQRPSWSPKNASTSAWPPLSSKLAECVQLGRQSGRSSYSSQSHTTMSSAEWVIDLPMNTIWRSCIRCTIEMCSDVAVLHLFTDCKAFPGNLFWSNCMLASKDRSRSMGSRKWLVGRTDRRRQGTLLLRHRQSIWSRGSRWIERYKAEAPKISIFPSVFARLLPFLPDPIAGPLSFFSWVNCDHVGRHVSP
jgi:hypothetical protein